MAEILVIILLGGVGAFWFFANGFAFFSVLSTPVLPAGKRKDDAPSVTVIIPARNEAARIRQAVLGLRGQTGVKLQIIVVDDRSTDDTSAILANLAAEITELQVVRVDELPPGWLGKCHACARGAENARGEWLLFMDGDSHPEPSVIADAVAAAKREDAAHVTLWPLLNCEGTLTRGCIIAWSHCLFVYAPPVLINRDLGGAAVGVGAFNLVRRDAYEAMGGYEALRMEVVDDVKLGRLIRRAGYRQRVYSGVNHIETEWAHGLRECVLAVEKNWFAGVDFSWAKGIGVAALAGFGWVAAVVGPLLHPVAGWFALAGLLSTIFPAILQARSAGWSPLAAVASPVGYFVFAVAGVHSMWRAGRQGGIRWRDTFYPLAELRAGLVR